MTPRRGFAAFALSLALHASLIGFAAAIVFSVLAPRDAIRVTVLPGGGGNGGDSAKPAGEAIVPAAKPAVEEQPMKVPAQKVFAPRKREHHEAVSPAKEAPSLPAASTSADVASAGSIAASAGSGGGSGGGVGSGTGEGTGAGTGSGRAVNLRLYCVSCPEPLYPHLARARGWQGATDVELTVLADGRVDGATVARSSGFDVLDNAALEVARQSRFSPPPPNLDPPVRGLLAYRFELRAP